MDLAFLPLYFEGKKGFLLAYKSGFVLEMDGFALFLCLKFRDFHFFKIIFCHFCVLLTNKEPCMYQRE